MMEIEYRFDSVKLKGKELEEVIFHLEKLAKLPHNKEANFREIYVNRMPLNNYVGGYDIRDYKKVTRGLNEGADLYIIEHKHYKPGQVVELEV